MSTRLHTESLLRTRLSVVAEEMGLSERMVRTYVVRALLTAAPTSTGLPMTEPIKTPEYDAIAFAAAE